MIVAVASLLAFGCTDYKSQVELLQKEKQQLVAQQVYKDSTINDFVTSINEIEQSINSITEKQKLVSSNVSGELRPDAKMQILGDINEIDKLLQENQTRINALSKKLKGSSIKIAQFEKMIESLKSQLAVKDTEMAAMTDQINSLNNTVATLNTQVENLNHVTADKLKTIEDQTSKMHTAYFTKGTYKELSSKQVVVKDGGFLGLGKAELLKKDFDRTAFTTIDIMKVTDIPISCKVAELLTNHPSDSYTLKKDDKNLVSDLVITDPEKFWSASKYLVVLENK